MILGMFFSPRWRALATASDMIRLAFSCLSKGATSSWLCVRRGVLFSEGELDEDEEEDDDDEDDDDEEEEEEEDELLFITGLRARTWLAGPLVFFRGFKITRKKKSAKVDVSISKTYYR